MIFHCTLAVRTPPLGTTPAPFIPAQFTPAPFTPAQFTPAPGAGTPDPAADRRPGPDVQLVELAVEVPTACPGAELEAAIIRRYGTGRLSARGAPVAALTVGVAPLVPGAVLVDNTVLAHDAVLAHDVPTPSRSGPAPRDRPTLLLAVHSGPGAGTITSLRRGLFRIGRSGTEIVIPDAALSREHARLDVSETDVTIVDLGSVNGTSVDGRKVRAAQVTTASTIRCGDSTMSVRLGPPVVADAATESLTVAAGSSVAEPLVVRGGAAASHWAALLLAAVLPLLVGVGLAVLTGMWIFLAFTAVSGLSVLVPLLSGRRQRRDLDAAVAAAVVLDRERRRRAAPSAADLAILSAAGSSPAALAIRGQPPGVWLRLGLADQPANLRLEPPGPGFRPPPLGRVPLTLDPASAVITIHGPGPAVAGLVRSFILQLAAYPLSGNTSLLVHGPPDNLPLSARFLPRVTLSSNDAATAALLAAGPGQGCDHGIFILCDTPWQRAAFGPSAAARSSESESGAWPVPGAGHVFRPLAAAHGWRMIECSPDRGPGENPGIVLGPRGTLVTAESPPVDFVPDLVPTPVFDRFCRTLAGTPRSERHPQPGLPPHCCLADVLPLGDPDILRRWSRTAPGAGLGAPVGAGKSGVLRIDLKTDGPHFLVAGTTGSGKSEFLRTLAAGLAASHPPDRVNLLFIDFKGGSGLGPLSELPHCVGMLTDLAGADVERALISLRAEVRRRETLLSRAEAPDLAAYEASPAAGPPVPYLVIVVDEFRILVDEAPGALAELMRIAAIGRSLGIHLIMATQRPQGALNADIRANVTTCIALRVQSGLESIDVIGSGLAAAIPIDRPGRAFLIRGAQAPEEFQTATLAPGTVPREAQSVTVRSVADELLRPQTACGALPDGFPTRGDRDGRTAPAPALEEVSFVDVVLRLWRDVGGRKPSRPVADPLPAPLQYPLQGPADPELVRLGRVDLPELQRVADLGWSPARHGHLGLVGAEAAGDAALALTVDQLLTGAAESHLYILDAAGGFAADATSPRVGAVAGLHEVRRAARVLQRVAEEALSRLRAPAAGRPGLVLVLSGWGAWVSAFRSGPQAWAEDLVHDIVRDGSRAGITVVVSGGRELVTARFFAGLPNRIFFPLGSTEEGRVAWPRMPALESVAGRVAVFGAFVPAPLPAGHAAQLFEPVPGPRRTTAVAGSTRPFRVDSLPASMSVDEVLAKCGRDKPGERSTPQARLTAPGRAAAQVPSAGLLLGVGGDELRPYRVRLPAGGVLAVLGGPAAGKSTLLAALPSLNPDAAWLAPPAGTDPADYWPEAHASALAGSLDRRALLLADDADLLPPDANASLASLNGLGWSVIFAAGFGPVLGQRGILAAAARSQGRAVLIRPRGLMDAEPFGVRYQPEHSPPPGRAVVISEGRAVPVQLAALHPAGRASQGGRRSGGP